jgi:septal ring factor EnvC (AmiA/AmiB activator)
MQITRVKIIIILFAILLAYAFGLQIFQWRYQAHFNALKTENDRLKDQNHMLEADRDAWKVRASLAEDDAKKFKEQADKASQEALLAQQKADELAKKLKAIPKPKPPADPNDLPKDQEHLLGAFQIQGFQPFPIQDPKSLAFPLENSTRILALVMDGKNYPGALRRVALLEEQNTALNSLVDSKNKVLDSMDKELESTQKALNDMKNAEKNCDDELKNNKKITDNLDGQIKALQKELKAEKPKKWLFGGMGLLLGLGVLLL